MWIDKISIIVVVAVASIAVCGCHDTSADSDHNAIDVKGVAELPLPEVPAELTQPEDRAAYMTLHFWDDLDFATDSMATDTAFVEQNFVNFISILPYAKPEDARLAADRLVQRASATDRSASLMCHTVDRYLGDPNSPMRSDELYVTFLNSIITSRRYGLAATERAAYRLEQTKRNWPGTRAADIKLLMRDNKGSRLLDVVRADTTLVMFYDPDCEHCKEVTERLKQSPIGAHSNILAIDVAGNRALWDSTKHMLPQHWRVAYALEAVDDEKYYLPALPSLYLIAPDGTVILKDIPAYQLP